MALPVFQAAGTKAEGATSCSPAWPAHQALDIALLFVEVRFGDDVPDPSGEGWAPVENSPQMFVGGGTVSTTLAIFWKRAASAAEAAPSLSAANHIVAQILTFRSCVATGDPWEADAGGGDALETASTAVAIPGGETTVDDCLIVAAVAMGQDIDTAQFSDWANADLADVAERADSFTAIGNGGGFGVATGEKATAGAFGVTSATSATSFAQARISLALLPAEDEGGTTVSGVGAIASAEAFGVAQILRALKNVGAISPAEAVGTARAIRALKNAGAVESGEAVGVPRAYRLLRHAGGVASSEAFGSPRIYRVLAQAGAISSAEALGEPAVTVVEVSDADVSAAGGIASAEAFGVAAIIRGLANGGGIGSGEEFGTTRLVRPLGAVGVASGEAVGDPRVRMLLTAAGIASEEAFSTSRVLRVVFATSLTSGEAFGTAIVDEFEPPPPGTEPAYGNVVVSDEARYQVVVSDGETWLVAIRDIPLGTVAVEDQLKG